MCSITTYDKLLPICVYYISSDDSRSIPKNATTTALESLGETLNFIYCWIKKFQQNYQVRWKIYNEAIKYLIKKIPTNKSKQLSQE